MTQNKNLNPLLNLRINYISTRSAPQTVSAKNFLIIALCNSSASSLLEIISFLVADYLPAWRLHQMLFIKTFIDHSSKFIDHSSFPNESVENAEIYKPILNKKITTHE